MFLRSARSFHVRRDQPLAVAERRSGNALGGLQVKGWASAFQAGLDAVNVPVRDSEGRGQNMLSFGFALRASTATLTPIKG